MYKGGGWVKKGPKSMYVIYGRPLISDNAFLTRSNPCKYYGEEGKYGAIGATSRGKSNPQLLLD